MGRLFSPDSGLMKGLAMVGDLVLLNVLFLLCCLPVFTAGAAAAAMYTVTLQYAGHRESGVVKPFFRAFKKSFFKAAALEILFFALGCLIYLGIRVINADPGRFPWVFNAVYAIVGILLLIVTDWSWPIEAQFESSIGKTLKNALLLGISHPLVTLATLALSLIPAVLLLFAAYWFWQFGAVWFLFGFSGIAMLNSMMFIRVFKPYMTVEDNTVQKESSNEEEQS